MSRFLWDSPTTTKALTTSSNGNGHHPQVKTIPTVIYPAELFWDMPGNYAGEAGIGVRRAFRVVSLVYACLTYRATKLIEPPVWIAEENDDGETMLEGEHPLTELLEQPNPDMDMGEFLTLVSLYLDVTGACLLVKNENNAGLVGSMYPYARDEFAVEPANGRLFGKFKVQTLTGYREFGPDDVIYLRRPSTENYMANVAPLDAALEHVHIGQAMRTAIRAVMRNAVKPSAIFRSEKELGDDVFNRLNQEIRANWAGVTNHGKSILLEGITEAHVLDSNLKNLELGPIQDDVEAAICQVFQIHPLLVGAKFGINNNSGFADSIGPAQTLFYDLCAFPTWAWIEKKFTAGLLRPIDDDPRRFIRFDTSKVRALIPDMGEKVEQAAAASAFWTVNEQRAHTGKPPIADGDEIRIPVAPGDEAQEEDDDDDTVAKSAEFKVDEDEPFVMVSPVMTGRGAVAMSETTLATVWQGFDAKATKLERSYERAAKARFADEAKQVIDILESSVPDHKDVLDDALREAALSLVLPYLAAAELKILALYAAGGPVVQEWATAFKKLVTRTFRAAGQSVSNDAAVAINFNLANPRAALAVQRRVSELSGHVTETTKQAIRDTLEKARQDGVGVGEMATRIRRDVFGGEVTQNRAKLIARTESVGALNEAEHLSALETGGVLRAKRWVSQRDARVRPTHAAENDTGWVPIDQPYPVTGKQYPHDGVGGAAENANCRCTQIFTDLTADEANTAPKGAEPPTPPQPIVVNVQPPGTGIEPKSLIVGRDDEGRPNKVTIVRESREERTITLTENDDGEITEASIA